MIKFNNINQNIIAFNELNFSDTLNNQLCTLKDSFASKLVFSLSFFLIMIEIKLNASTVQEV